MKKQSTNLFAPLAPELLHALRTQVEETLSRDASPERNKVFTTGNLWQIRRQARNFVQRRNIF